MLCALAALATGGGAAAASLAEQHWDTTALVRIHDTIRVSRLALRDDPTFRLRHISGFYDGVFFYTIARDPLATGEAHRLVTQAPYHYGHPGYGWLTWLASAGGRPRFVPDALLAVALAAMLVAGAAASLLARLLGWNPWAGLVVAVNPGLVFAVANDNSETVGAALLLLGLVAYLLGRRGWALALLAALCLVKEPLALVPLALAGWEWWRRRSGLVLAAAVVPAVLWWIYLRIHLGALPFGHGGRANRLTYPFLGWGKGLLAAAAQSWNVGVDTAQLGQAAVPVIVVVWLGILAVAVFALRLRTAVQPAFLALAALYMCISKAGVQYPKDLVRELAIVLTLLPFALADPPGFARRGPPARLLSERRRES